MISDLTISLIQTPLYWENPGANRAMLEEKLWGLKNQTDIILLPEMFTTGFSMNAEALFETMNLHTHKWMVQMAKHTASVIAGSIIIKEHGKYFNRFLWVEPSGKTEHYDKKHPFSYAKENEVYNAGNEKLIISYRGIKLRPIICYDLRFPVWSKNHYDESTGLEYDALLVVANWPEKRVEAWDTLLKARAIENHAYCIGVNRIGVDENKIAYSGHSGAYFPTSETLAFSTEDGILNVTISKAKLEKYREDFPFYLDGV